MNLLKATGTIGGLTLASRVLGLVRDSLFARYIGASFVGRVPGRVPPAQHVPRAVRGRRLRLGVHPDVQPEGWRSGRAGLPDGLHFAEQALAVLLLCCWR
jgi:putative peptidoglycan lipid II flippase